MIKSAFSVIFVTAIIVLAVDASISQVADFLIEQTTSLSGISSFVFFVAVLVIVSFVLFQFIKNTTTEIRASSRYIRAVFAIALATQLTLIGILTVVLVQIFLLSEYYTVLLLVATAVGYASAATVMVISSLTLFGWYKVNRGSYVVLIFGVAFAVNVYIYLYLVFYETSSLAEKNQIITPDSEVIYSSDSFQPGSSQEVMRNIYDYAATGNFVLLVAGSATLLHHYASKIGRVRFWTLLLLPLVYYLSTLVDTLGIYVPESDSDFFNYYLYVSLTGVVGGTLLGFAFWRISKTLTPNRSATNYLRLCSYGFIFQSIAEVGGLAAASYPPFGFVSFSMLTLSSSMIIMGLYSTAISVSQDVRLRQYIKDLTKADSGFLSTIGQAQLERKVQAKAADLENVVKKERLELEKKSGVESSIQEQDIKQYLLEVLQEVDKHKSSS